MISGWLPMHIVFELQQISNKNNTFQQFYAFHNKLKQATLTIVYHLVNN